MKFPGWNFQTLPWRPDVIWMTRTLTHETSSPKTREMSAHSMQQHEAHNLQNRPFLTSMSGILDVRRDRLSWGMPGCTLLGECGGLGLRPSQWVCRPAELLLLGEILWCAQRGEGASTTPGVKKVSVWWSSGLLLFNVLATHSSDNISEISVKCPI